MGPLFPRVVMSALFSQLFPPAELCVPNQLPALLLRCGDAKKLSRPLDTGSPLALGTIVSPKFQQGPHFWKVIFSDLWHSSPLLPPTFPANREGKRK